MDDVSWFWWVVIAVIAFVVWPSPEEREMRRHAKVLERHRHQQEKLLNEWTRQNPQSRRGRGDWLQPDQVSRGVSAVGNLGYEMAYTIAFRRAGFLKWVIGICWFLVPILGQTIVHPSDAAGFWYWLNSQHPPSFYTSHEVVRGEFTALLSLGAVIFVYLVAITLFYRRTQYFVALWPLAALLVGVIGNAGWWFGTGYWDSTGALAGWFPAVMAGIGSAVCERLGANFVFGKGGGQAFSDEGDY